MNNYPSAPAHFDLHSILPRSKPWLTVAIMVAGDTLVLALAWLTSLNLRFDTTWNRNTQSYIELWPSLVIFILFYALLGLYSGVSFHPAEEMRRLVYSTSLVFLMLAALSFILKASEQYSRFIFLSSWMLAILALPLMRALLRALFGKFPWWGRAVVVLGAGKTGEMVIATLKSRPELGLKPVACLDDDPAKRGMLQGVPVIGGLEYIPALSSQLPGAYAILAMPGIPRQRMLEIIETYAAQFQHLFLIPDLFGFSTIWLTAKDLGGILGLELRQQLLFPVAQIAKHLLDAVLFLIVIIPVIIVGAILAILIRLDSPGPAIYRQTRLGRNGKPFDVLKFRTMYLDADDRLSHLLASDEKLRAEYHEFHKLRQDPRVTRVGRLLRKTSLDELPQIWNVLLGEMSFVGPRAYLISEQAQMESKDATILRVLPGITGMWQVSGRSRLSFTARLDMDVYYVRNWSVWLDIYLLVRTFWVVVTLDGAF